MARLQLSPRYSRLSLWLGGAALAVVVVLVLELPTRGLDSSTLHPAGDQRAHPSALGQGALAGLPLARVQLDARRQEIVIELPPVNLEAGAPDREAMALTPICRVEVPTSGALYRYRVDVVDRDGHAVAGVTLHHLNLTDVSRRELFLPIGLHLFAASKETPPIRVPWLLLGVPVGPEQSLIAGAMVANAAPAARQGIRVRLVLGYVPAGRPWPIYKAYPFALDVLYPLGHPPAGSKAFDLPPGRTVRSWEGSPAVPGTVVGLGGHLHDYGVGLELADVTANKVLWHSTPVTDSLGRVLRLPVTRFYTLYRLGIHITPSHRYRVTATYDNPTGRMLCDGGMGAVAGAFIPDRGVRWPATDTSDATYRQDLRDTRENDPGHMQGMMRMMGHACGVGALGTGL